MTWKDERAFSYCYRRRDNFVRSFSRTRDTKKELSSHTWQTVSCSQTFYPRVAKYLKDNKHDSSDITCFSKFTVSPHNCTHLGTDNVRGQLSVPVFAPNEGCSFSINFSLINHLFGRPVHRFDWLVRFSTAFIQGKQLLFKKLRNEQGDKKGCFIIKRKQGL